MHLFLSALLCRESRLPIFSSCHLEFIARVSRSLELLLFVWLFYHSHICVVLDVAMKAFPGALPTEACFLSVLVLQHPGSANLAGYVY